MSRYEKRCLTSKQWTLLQHPKKRESLSVSPTTKWQNDLCFSSVRPASVSRCLACTPTLRASSFLCRSLASAGGPRRLPSSIMVHLLGIWSSHGNIGLGYGWLTIYETCRGFLSNKGYYQIIQVIRPWLSIETYIWFWRSPILGCPMLCNRSFPRKLVDTLILGDWNPSSCWLKSMRGWWSILFPEPKGRVSFEVGACPWQHQASQRCHLPRGGSKFADYLLSFWHS